MEISVEIGITFWNKSIYMYLIFSLFLTVLVCFAPTFTHEKTFWNYSLPQFDVGWDVAQDKDVSHNIREISYID